MNGTPHAPLPASVEIWRGEFMQAAERHAARRRSPLRRLLAPLIAALIIGTAGVATAAIVDQLNGPDVPPYAGETHAFMNLETGMPIRCPDGSMLTYTPPPGTGVYMDAKCDDGSVPAVYARQLEALRDYAQGARFGAQATDGPRFAYQVDSGN